MAGEDVGGAAKISDDSLEGWFDAKAEELGVSRAELLAQLKNGDASDVVLDDEFDAVRREFAEHLADARDEFDSELADVEREFDEKIQDVRERVVQVKRETDENAPADHDHADLRQRTEDVADRTDRLATELESLSETVTTIDDRVETGFENYEDVLEYLTDTTDDFEAKLTTLAEEVVDLGNQIQTLSARHASRAAADELAHLANRRGVESAECGHCGETVHVGLLADPKCPHCASTFNDVEPKRGFFGAARLVVGDPPALEGERADWDVDSVMEADTADINEVLDDIIEEDAE